MAIEIKVPDLPESVSEATVGGWNKQPGDSVGRDENLVDLETDKIMLEVPAPAAGSITKIMKQDGDTVQAGDVLALFEEGDGSSAGASQSSDDDASDDGGDQGDAPAQESSPATSGSDDSDEGGDEDAIASPSARKMMAENNLQPGDIKGSGKGGRISKSDVKEYLESRSAKSSASKEPAPKSESASAPKPAAAPAKQAPTSAGDRMEQRVPMTRIRARIAERLIEAQQNAAILTTFNEVDLHEVGALRGRYKDAFQKENDVKLGFMSFFVKATVEALKRYPVVNASVDGNDIIYHGYFDIGIAVSSPRGLVVPILRDADQLSFAEIEQKILDFGLRARDNKLTMDDLTGGTFSISNGGTFGSMMSTPILNPPQSAILGMHNIVQRPMVVNGEIAIRPMMYLAMSYDHRIIDGREAVLCLRTIKECLEDPARLLLQV